MYKYNEFILEYKKRSDKSDYIEDFADLYIDRIAKKLGTKVIKKLGKGAFGIAYLVGKDKVIKVTTDKKEAENAIRLSDIELEYFLNYYDVFEMTLDNVRFDEKAVYFILMDYVRPLRGKEKEYWNKFYADFFSNYDDEDFLDIVYHDYVWVAEKVKRDPTKEEIKKAEAAVEYFKPFLNQRQKMLDEASDYGIEFLDAHANNLGIRESDGAIIYFDIGYYDTVTIEGEGGEKVEYDIDRIDFENDFKKIKDMIISKYKPDTPLNINDVIKSISKLLNINRVKAYKYLRDEVFAYYNKYSTKSPIFFTAKSKDVSNWKQGNSYNYYYHSINPLWKTRDMDIALVYLPEYKDASI